MQAVRCDACGMKALVAASQCPHCGHLLDLRDSFGELLPLVHCSTCDSYYPQRDGSCRWCGTQPESVRLGPILLKGAGAVAFIGMALAAWLTRDGSGERTVEPAAVAIEPRMVTVLPAEPGSTDPAAPPVLDSTRAASGTAPTGADTATVVATPAPPLGVVQAQPAVGETTVTRSDPGVSLSTADSAPARATAAVSTVAIDTTRTGAIRRDPAPSRALRPATRPRRATWTSAVVLSWVTVRAGPGRTSRIVGSIGPDTHVQLGELRGDWLRVRTRGLAGWVEQSRFASRRSGIRRPLTQ